jgi:dihydroorotate dehydrogenase (fumarate)
MIGAGACKTLAQTVRWLKIAPVVSGSYTFKRRGGHAGKVSHPETLEEFLALGFGLNNYSMPNVGYEAIAGDSAQLQSEQPLIASIAGFCVEEYVTGVELFSKLETVSAIELNFGCPNTQGDHPDIISFNPEVVKVILFELSKRFIEVPIWLKFSPYSNPAELKRMAEIVNGFADLLNLTVVTCNTFPMAYDGEGKIDPQDGFAGLSGPVMKRIALGQVKQFRGHLSSAVDVIGVGGITTGNDIVDFLNAGATAVQITSLAYWAGDSKSFQERLLDEETGSRFLKLLESNT